MEQQELYFTSDKCPELQPTNTKWVTREELEKEYGTPGNTGRPLKADSQCHKLAVALLHGSLTSMKSISITGGSEAPRRLRELRKMLKAHGIELIEEWVENWDSEKKHTRFKRYTIAFADLEKFKELIGI